MDKPSQLSQALKGKPETGIYATVIYPKLTIRFPYAAPFEFCLALSNWPTDQRVNFTSTSSLLA
jgi:hypothetical protein